MEKEKYKQPENNKEKSKAEALKEYFERMDRAEEEVSYSLYNIDRTKKKDS